MQSFHEMLQEEEAKRLAEARAEIAKEKADWDALSSEAKAAKAAEFEAKYERLFEASECDDEDLDEEDEDD